MSYKICPKCNRKYNLHSNYCGFCPTRTELKVVEEQPQARPQSQPNPQANPNIMQCPVCGKYMSRFADYCPSCGNPRYLRPSGSRILDCICMISVFIAMFLHLGGLSYVGYAIMLFWLIVYNIIYVIAKNDYDVDETNAKKSLIALFIIFILEFGLTFYFTIG